MNVSKIYWLPRLNYRAGGASVHVSLDDVGKRKDADARDKTDDAHVHATMMAGARANGQPWRPTAGVSVITIEDAEQLFGCATGHGGTAGVTLRDEIAADIKTLDADDPRRAIYDVVDIEYVAVYGFCRSLTLADVARRLGEAFDLSQVEIPITVEPNVTLVSFFNLQEAENELDNAGRRKTSYADAMNIMRRHMSIDEQPFTGPKDIQRRCHVTYGTAQKLFAMFLLCDLVKNGWARLDYDRPETSERGGPDCWIPLVPKYTLLTGATGVLQEYWDAQRTWANAKGDEVAAATDALAAAKSEANVAAEAFITQFSRDAKSMTTTAKVTSNRDWSGLKTTIGDGEKFGGFLAQAVLDGRLDLFRQQYAALLMMSCVEVDQMVAHHAALVAEAEAKAAEAAEAKPKARATAKAKPKARATAKATAKAKPKARAK